MLSIVCTVFSVVCFGFVLMFSQEVFCILFSILISLQSVLLAVDASVHVRSRSSPILDVSLFVMNVVMIFSTENQYLQIIVVKLSVMLLFEF